MGKKTRIEISEQLKKELNRRIVNKYTSYGYYIGSLLDLSSSYAEASAKYPKEMEQRMGLIQSGDCL